MYYQSRNPGQVQVLGADGWNGTVGQLQDFKDFTGITFPLLLNGSSSAGGNFYTLYGPYDNYIVINKQGIVRYHAALSWPLGNRYHKDQIRGSVDSLVTSTVDVGEEPGRRSLALRASPNPSRGRVAVELVTPGAGVARVEVFDVSGRRVASLWNGPVAAGTRRLSWNPGGEAGGPASAGVYLVTAEVDGRKLSTRAVLVP